VDAFCVASELATLVPAISGVAVGVGCVLAVVGEDEQAIRLVAMRNRMSRLNERCMMTSSYNVDKMCIRVAAVGRDICSKGKHGRL
jgi:hypothetical protein